MENWQKEIIKLPLTHQQEILPEYEDMMGHMNVMYYTYLFDRATYGLFGMFGFGVEYHRSISFFDG